MDQEKFQEYKEKNKKIWSNLQKKKFQVKSLEEMKLQLSGYSCSYYMHQNLRGSGVRDNLIFEKTFKKKENVLARETKYDPTQNCVEKDDTSASPAAPIDLNTVTGIIAAVIVAGFVLPICCIGVCYIIYRIVKTKKENRERTNLVELEDEFDHVDEDEADDDFVKSAFSHEVEENVTIKLKEKKKGDKEKKKEEKKEEEKKEEEEKEVKKDVVIEEVVEESIKKKDDEEEVKKEVKEDENEIESNVTIKLKEKKKEE